jgi:hypothetical protein
MAVEDNDTLRVRVCVESGHNQRMIVSWRGHIETISLFILRFYHFHFYTSFALLLRLRAD